MVFFQGEDAHTLIGREICVLLSLMFGEEEKECNALKKMHWMHGL